MIEETVMSGDEKDILHVYEKIVELYGIEIFKEPRRAIGCLLDLAPKRKKEAHYLAVAYELGIPQAFIDNQINSKLRAQEVAEQLKNKNVPEESALVIIKAFGKLFGGDFSLEREHRDKLFIPYVTNRDDSIAEAIQHLDHIRWFLNHQNRYHWEQSSEELDILRQMMYLPQENYKKIRQIYRQMVYHFQNDPFKATLVMHCEAAKAKGNEKYQTDEKIKENEITAKNFGDYFIVVYNEPVSMSFACYYEEAIIDNSIYSWKIKKKNFCSAVERCKEELLQQKLPDGNSIRTQIKGIHRFITYSTILLFVSFFSFYQWIVKCKYAHQYGSIKEYTVYVACSVMLVLFALILILSCACSVYRGRQFRKAEMLSEKISRQIIILEQDIPEKIEEIDKVIVDFYAKKSGAADFKKRDYCLFFNKAEMKQQKLYHKNITSNVPKLGKWSFAILLVLFFVYCLLYIVQQ